MGSNAFWPTTTCKCRKSGRTGFLRSFGNSNWLVLEDIVPHCGGLLGVGLLGHNHLAVLGGHLEHLVLLGLNATQGEWEKSSDGRIVGDQVVEAGEDSDELVGF